MRQMSRPSRLLSPLPVSRFCARLPRTRRHTPDREDLMALELNRRKFTAAGAASLAFPYAPAIAQGAPFKIGLLTVKTGPLAQGGNQMEQGISVFLKEKANTLAGRKIELVVADTG